MCLLSFLCVILCMLYYVVCCDGVAASVCCFAFYCLTYLFMFVCWLLVMCYVKCVCLNMCMVTFYTFCYVPCLFAIVHVLICLCVCGMCLCCAYVCVMSHVFDSVFAYVLYVSCFKFFISVYDFIAYVDEVSVRCVSLFMFNVISLCSCFNMFMYYVVGMLSCVALFMLALL